MIRSPDVFLAKLAMMPAVEDINQQSERQPDDEAQPGNERQPEHQPAAQKHGDQREPGYKGHAEGTLAIRLLASKKDYPQGNQHEGKQRPDVGEVGRSSNIHESGGNTHGKTGD